MRATVSRIAETAAKLEAFDLPLRERLSGEAMVDLAPHLHLQMLAELYRRGEPTNGDIDEVVAILERNGAREFTRGQARRYRDEALAELVAAGVVDGRARERLEQIIVSVIAA